jgi:hypothetical protein
MKLSNQNIYNLRGAKCLGGGGGGGGAHPPENPCLVLRRNVQYENFPVPVYRKNYTDIIGIPFFCLLN